jgi:hypothetical protein
MNRRRGRDPLFARTVISLYPRGWRDRYGEEFATLLTDMAAAARWPARARLVIDAASGALDARLNPSLPAGGRLMPDRIRRAVAAVACAVVAFTIAGGGFQKMTEDPAFQLAAHEHTAISASFDTLRVAAILAGVAVLAGGLPLAWSVVWQAVTARRTVACTWATVAILRRADLPPGLLRPQVVPMAVLSVCMAVVTGADLSWGLAVRSASSSLFHSNNGLVATSLPPSWVASVVVLAIRELRTPAPVPGGPPEPAGHR